MSHLAAEQWFIAYDINVDVLQQPPKWAPTLTWRDLVNEEGRITDATLKRGLPTPTASEHSQRRDSCAQWFLREFPDLEPYDDHERACIHAAWIELDIWGALHPTDFDNLMRLADRKRTA